MISFRCEDCDSKLSLAERFAGATIKCPECGWPNIVPTGEDEQAKPKKKKKRRGRRWRKVRQTSADKPVSILGVAPERIAQSLDGFAARLTASCRKSDEAGIAPVLRQLAALGAAAIILSALTIAGLGLFEYFTDSRTVYWWGLAKTFALPGVLDGILPNRTFAVSGVADGVILHLLISIAAAVAGYLLAASSCTWLKRDIAMLSDPTPMRVMMVLSLLLAAALVVTAVSTFIERNALGLAARTLLAACFAAIAAYLFRNPGLVGIRVTGIPSDAPQPAFAAALGLFDAIAKVLLLLGIVGFMMHAAIVFVVWAGAAPALFIPGKTARTFIRWGVPAGVSSVGHAVAMPAMGYLCFFGIRIVTGFARSVLRIARAVDPPVVAGTESPENAPERLTDDDDTDSLE